MIEKNVEKRWENGIEHNIKSISLYERISQLDYEFNDDYFCFKSGGDGDNGEHLLYLLDIYFEELEIRN
jgi:hypothetical protein